MLNLSCAKEHLRKRSTGMLLLFSMFLAGNTLAAAPVAAAPQAAGRQVLPAGVAPERYRIDIDPDVESLSFRGKVSIALRVDRPVRRIVLNAADLVIEHAVLSGEPGAPSISYDPQVQTASFDFGHALARGAHTLTLDYRGRIYQQSSGLFALDYETPTGKSRALFTQFEAADARRFVPCWDEPGRKASFELSATVPGAQLAISNMPIAAMEPLSGGRKRVHFAVTPKMSSYLLFFGAGDFERVARVVDGVDVGVIVKRGDTASAAYALDAAAEILPFYDLYFGVPYPLPKLDMIAGPGAGGFGAMENWGAIYYFEKYLLMDPRISTQADRRRVFGVVAHEMAHQWFGDLVTMAWWDDLWLNEGFATWMTSKATEHFHPEWRAWLDALGDTQIAMDIDAREGTHPIITPIQDILQAATAFDAITYLKGSAVIRMLESYLGEDAFRAGVRRYLRKHAYGNAVTDELWRALDAGARHPITPMAHDFTLQAGIPLVTASAASCSAGTSSVRLSQGQFAIAAEAGGSPTWQVPVTLAAPGGAIRRSVVAGARPQRRDLPACGPVILNAGQSAYFRSSYASQDYHKLLARFDELAAEDQFGLLNDTRSLALAGQESMEDLLELAGKVPANADPLVLRSLVGILSTLDRLYDGLPGQDAFRRHARVLLAPVLAQVGWDGKAGESDNIGLLRLDLIAALGGFADPEVMAEARRRFALFLTEPQSLDAGSRHIVLDVIARHADSATWASLHALAVSAKSELEREEYYVLLAGAEDAALVQMALELAVSAEPPETSGPAMISAAAHRHPQTAFDFATAHWDALKTRLGGGRQVRFVPRLISDAAEIGLADRLEAWAEGHIPANARQDVRKAEAEVRYRASIRDQRLPDIDRWLARQTGQPRADGSP